MLINTVELALTLILPLIIFYRNGIWGKASYLYIPLLYLIWYLTYALFHESCHLIAAYAFRKEVFNLHLIPHFWEGEFGNAYIEYDFQGDINDFFIILMPYLKDFVFIIIGYILLRGKILKKALLSGLVLILFVLSSLYDIVNNYTAFILGDMNDFNSIRVSTNSFISHSIGISFSAISLFFTLNILKRNKVNTSKLNA